jgi:hypothetical protein
MTESMEHQLDSFDLRQDCEGLTASTRQPAAGDVVILHARTFCPCNGCKANVGRGSMQRDCSFDDVCNATLFPTSDKSSYISGIALSVSGSQEMS